jgi:hypothetical protein
MLTSHAMTALYFKSHPDYGQPNTIDNITLLISHQGRDFKSMRFKKKDNILLDGPYGHNLDVDSFDTVCLTAKGIGIVGILSFALGLTMQGLREGNLSRNINLFWVLEHNYQETWVGPQLEELQKMDVGGVSAPNSTLAL